MAGEAKDRVEAAGASESAAGAPGPRKPAYDGLLSVIIPCKDEAESIPLFYAEFLKVADSMGNPDFELIFVEDGSSDSTLDEIKRLASEDSRVRFISFSRNFGKEAAMHAGMQSARGDYVTVMDADLQDPPELLPKMFDAILNEGYDSAAACRITRDGESPLRSFFARAFYKALNFLSPMKFREGARDYRLMKRKLVDEILKTDEANRFTKGLYEWVGYRTKWIDYKNVPRRAGTTKWSFWQLAVYSLDALTSFSTVPLAAAAVVGLVFCALSSLAIVILAVRQMIFHNSAFGWTSMICAIFFLSGLQLFCLGMLGQYMAKIYNETKRRPHFVIREKSF